jgi:hypothetical protein
MLHVLYTEIIVLLRVLVHLCCCVSKMGPVCYLTAFGDKVHVKC